MPIERSVSGYRLRVASCIRIRPSLTSLTSAGLVFFQASASSVRRPVCSRSNLSNDAFCPICHASSESHSVPSKSKKTALITMFPPFCTA